MTKRMTGEEINTMLRMYEHGWTAKEIGQQIGRSPSVITSTLARMKKQLTCRDPEPRTLDKDVAEMKKIMLRDREERANFLFDLISYIDKFKVAHYPSWIFEPDHSPSSVQDTET